VQIIENVNDTIKNDTKLTGRLLGFTAGWLRVFSDFTWEDSENRRSLVTSKFKVIKNFKTSNFDTKKKAQKTKAQFYLHSALRISKKFENAFLLMGFFADPIYRKPKLSNFKLFFISFLPSRFKHDCQKFQFHNIFLIIKIIHNFQCTI
jgi:hypothetical protein